MRFGFYLPTRGRTAEPRAIEAMLAHGESLGFSSVVIADHLVFPVTIDSKYPYTVSGAFPRRDRQKICAATMLPSHGVVSHDAAFSPATKPAWIVPFEPFWSESF